MKAQTSIRARTRGLAARFPAQHQLHEKWWLQKGRRTPLLTEWNLERRTLFVHVPKCAGSSVYKALDMPFPKIGAHIPIAAYRQQLGPMFPMFESFSFARNPWDRFVSAFHYIAFHGELEDERKVALYLFGDNPDFGKFISRFAQDDRFARLVMTFQHFRPQAHFLFSANGTVRTANIFKIEDGLDQLENLGLIDAGSADPVRERASDRGDYRTYFDQSGRRAIERHYACDIEQLDYQF